MEKKTLGGIGIAIIVILVAALSMGCIDEAEVTNELDELREQVADMEEQMQAAKDTALVEAFMAEINELREQIEELEDNNIPTTYLIVRHTETEFNESFSAWGPCGRGENHIKEKALERAEDFADDLSTEEDITDITIRYDGREREWNNNNTSCYISYFYEVTWIENEYEEELVSAFGVEAWLDCTQ